MKKYEVDMHVHSYYSDSDCSVEELVKRIKESGLKGAVLTDHDTIDGVERFIKLCEKCGIDTMTGIEISSIYYYFTGAQNFYPAELHILGYGYDLASLSKDSELLYRNQVIRNHHVEDMIAKYRKGGEFDTSFIELTKQFNIHWPLISKYWIVKARTLNLMETKNMEFFAARALAKKEIAEGGPFHVKRRNFVHTDEAVKFIKKYGGIAVWAHPLIYLRQLEEYKFRNMAKGFFEEALCELKSFGIDGLEVFREDHSQDDQKFLLKYCDKYDLNPFFGGSDYHGDKEDEHMPGAHLGKEGIDYKQFLKLKK